MSLNKKLPQRVSVLLKTIVRWHKDLQINLNLLQFKDFKNEISKYEIIFKFKAADSFIQVSLNKKLPQRVPVLLSLGVRQVAMAYVSTLLKGLIKWLPNLN